MHVAFGMVTKEKVESILYNTAILVGPDGDLIGQHHKVHLQGEERIAFRAGYRLSVFETAFGSVGMMIGWDLAFPEVARGLVLEGAELLVVCANWEQPRADEWRVYLLARAYENAVFVAAANSGRRVRILHQLSQPPDHPVSIYHPEGEYLKGLVLEVE